MPLDAITDGIINRSCKRMLHRALESEGITVIIMGIIQCKYVCTNNIYISQYVNDKLCKI
jgi:hypothetical protein